MSPMFSLILDVLILVALGATVFYSINLSKQFNKLQADKKAFESLIRSLNLASSRSESVINSLKETALGGSEDLQEKISRARGMSDELEIMIQAGDSLANRLEELASQRPQTNKTQINEDDLKTKAEQDLLAAIKAKQK